MGKGPTIHITLDAKCKECGQGGAAQSGICMSCYSKAIQGKEMKSPEGKYLQKRFQQLKNQGGK